MKNFITSWLLATTMLTFLGMVSQAQNPNWTMPSGKFEPAGYDYTPLPSSPYHPDFGIVTDPNLAYQGEHARAMHGGYTDNNGNLLFFTVDEYVYDREGFVVGKMFENTQYTERKRGYNQRLILPMGNSCTKFAILTPNTADHLYQGQVESYSTDSSSVIHDYL